LSDEAKLKAVKEKDERERILKVGYGEVLLGRKEAVLVGLLCLEDALRREDAEGGDELKKAIFDGTPQESSPLLPLLLTLSSYLHTHASAQLTNMGTPLAAYSPTRPSSRRPSNVNTGASTPHNTSSRTPSRAPSPEHRLFETRRRPTTPPPTLPKLVSLVAHRIILSLLSHPPTLNRIVSLPPLEEGKQVELCRQKLPVLPAKEEKERSMEGRIVPEIVLDQEILWLRFNLAKKLDLEGYECVPSPHSLLSFYSYRLTFGLAVD
jgi:hypothetical protein